MGILSFNNKSSVRKIHRNKRALMQKKDKNKKDDAIFRQIIETSFFLSADIILTYVSTDFEVDTKELIKYSLNLGKKVAVPVSNYDDLTLNFYFINSLEDLDLGNFSILEPKETNHNNICCENNMLNSICIVPGIVFSESGHRIGYGKGFYDRFLENYKYFKIGLCYDINLISNIPHDDHDIAVDLVLTETQKLLIEKERLNYNEF